MNPSQTLKRATLIFFALATGILAIAAAIWALNEAFGEWWLMFGFMVTVFAAFLARLAWVIAEPPGGCR